MQKLENDIMEEDREVKKRKGNRKKIKLSGGQKKKKK